MKINFNGHFGRKHGKKEVHDFYRKKFEIEAGMFGLLKEAKIDREFRIPYDCKECPECGEGIKWDITENEIKALNKCKYPNGYPEIEFTINIPSGKMVVGNDFRGIFPVIGDHYVNHTIGIVRTTEDYAKVNMAHCFVGNTCPSVFKINNKSFVIGNTGAHSKHPVPKSKRVGGICTDLWWFSIADHDEFIKRGGKIGNYVDVIECKAGIYEFSHKYHLLDHNDYKSPAIYTTINWKSKPIELIDHAAEFKKLNFTAEQVMHELFRTNQDFYGSPSKGYIPDSYADGVSEGQGKQMPITREEWPYYFTAERLLCTYGGGLQWHPNGWATEGFTPQKDEPEVQIPIFNKPYNWGQPCQYSGLSEMVKSHSMGKEENANPSFVRLGFNILQCIIRYGAYEYGKNTQLVFEKNGRTVKWAKELYPLMVKKYGEPEIPYRL